MGLFPPRDHPLLARPQLLHTLEERLRHFPIVALLGPRQVGKTSLAKLLAEEFRAGQQLQKERIQEGGLQKEAPQQKNFQ